MSTLHPGYQLAGSDISYYQYPIDYNKFIPHFDFVIIRAGAGLPGGTWKEDIRFREFWRAFANRLPRATYWYFHPAADPIEQANAFLDIVNSNGGYDIEMGFYIDIEEKWTYTATYQAKKEYTDKVVKFINVVDKGIKTPYNKLTGIYTGGPFWRSYIDYTKIPLLSQRTSWLAQYFKYYPMTKPTEYIAGMNPMHIWQYSRKGGLPDSYMPGDGKKLGAYSFGLDTNVWLLSVQQFESRFHVNVPPEDLTKNLPLAIKPFRSGSIIRNGPSELTNQAVASTYMEPLGIIKAERDSRGKLWYQIGKNMWFAGWLGEAIYI